MPHGAQDYHGPSPRPMEAAGAEGAEEAGGLAGVQCVGMLGHLAQGLDVAGEPWPEGEGEAHLFAVGGGGHDGVRKRR